MLQLPFAHISQQMALCTLWFPQAQSKLRFGDRVFEFGAGLNVKTSFLQGPIQLRIATCGLLVSRFGTHSRSHFVLGFRVVSLFLRAHVKALKVIAAQADLQLIRVRAKVGKDTNYHRVILFLWVHLFILLLCFHMVLFVPTVPQFWVQLAHRVHKEFSTGFAIASTWSHS